MYIGASLLAWSLGCCSVEFRDFNRSDAWPKWPVYRFVGGGRGGVGGGGEASPKFSLLPKKVTPLPKLPALVYDILPPTTAIVDYAIGLEKLSANEQFFDDAQKAVSL